MAAVTPYGGAPPDSRGEPAEVRTIGPGALARLGLLVVAALLQLPPLRSSLSLDETGTFWVVKDDFASAISRSWRFQGQSPAYYSLAWAAVELGGRSEAVLRLPSLVAVALATYLVFAIGRRLLDAETGFLAAAVFVATPEVSYAAVDARPYALGLLALVAATLALIHWVERPRLLAGCLYGLLVALAIDSHYLLATALVAHPLYAILRWRSGGRPTLVSCAVPIVVATILVLPLATQLVSLAGRARGLSFAATPGWRDLLASLLPPMTPLVLVGALAAWGSGRARTVVWPRAATNGTIAFLLGWHALPRLVVFGVSCSTFMKLFVARYMLGAAPGWALLVAFGLRSIEPARGRSLIAVVLLTASAVTGASLRHAPEDWRQAAASIRELDPGGKTPVLANTDFIELNQVERLDDPEFRSYVLAPFACYSPGVEVTPVPLRIDLADLPCFERIANALSKSPRFIFVTLNAPLSTERWWLEGRMAAQGFVTRRQLVAGSVWIVVFEREKP